MAFVSLPLRISANFSLDDQSAETDTVTSASESIGNDNLFETRNESKVMISRKRKREQEETTKTETPLFSDCSPISDVPKLDHFLSSPSKDIFAPSTGSIFKSSIAAWSRKLHPMPSKYSGNDRKFIQVAQILAEQVILQTDFTTNPPEATKPFYNRLLWEKTDTDEDLLRDTMGRLFPQSEICSLKQYADIGKGATESTQGVSIGRLQKEHSFKPKTRPSPKAQPNLFQLEAPYTCIRRNQTSMDVLPSALLFWEELGLGPSHGEKNIVTLCMCPEIDYVQQGAKTFLGMLGSAYQSCKLGSHTQFPDTTGYSDGIVPVYINDGSFVSFIKELDRVCEKLGKRLSYQRSSLRLI